MNERMREIRDRLDAATPGPWESMRAGLGTRVVHEEGQFLTLVTPALKNSCDAEFIAHAPGDIRWLLDMLTTRGAA